MERQKFGHHQQDEVKPVLLMYQVIHQRIKELEDKISKEKNISVRIGFQNAKTHNEEILKTLMIGTDVSLNAVML